MSRIIPERLGELSLFGSVNIGHVSVLNVGAGDTKIVFDKTNPQDCIRAARIIKDMLRHGYALLIEVPGQGDAPPTFQRVHDFDENTCEYIIADLESVALEVVPDEEGSTDVTARPARGRRRIAADQTRGTAIARSAGG